MNCKEFEKNIPDFIAGKLDFQTLQEFGEHMRKCPGCKEEVARFQKKTLVNFFNL